MNQDLLYKYFKGNTSIEEEKQILDWVESSDENRKTFQKERMLYDIALFSDEKQAAREERKLRILPLMKWTARIAAIIAIVFAGGLLFRDYQYNKSAQLQTIAVPAGQRAQITLADGTKVWLNSQSTLTYATNFGRHERNVQLDGEAYFEVSKNKKIPFFVNTETNKVRVVGTSFNVCAYSGSKEFETTLVEGIVDVYTTEGVKPLTRLVKGEFFGSYDGKPQKKILPSYDYLRWKEGLYCFDDSPLDCMFSKLEKYYNVKITVNNPELLNYHCTGKFKEQDGIEHILRVIQKDHKFTYHISEERDSITIE